MAEEIFHQISTKVGVLIPTKNRPEKVRKLLSSISQSTLKPRQVIIVSSGIEISQIITEFQDELGIKYIHTEVTGQVAQKKIGIKLLGSDLDWVVFLDDDLILNSNCLEIAIAEAENYEKLTNENVVGVGLGLPSTSRTKNARRWVKIIGRLFIISSSLPGMVYKNGHAASYLDCKEITSTQWLNGASLWRRKVVDNYGNNLISTRYAACEDLLFSYPNYSLGKLIFVPGAKIEFQDEELTDFEKYSVFRAAALWRLYFVSSNSGFSRLLFLYSQLGRNLFGTFKTNEFPLKFLIKSTALWVELLYLSLSRKRIEKSLKNL